jgi:hypothetical protein
MSHTVQSNASSSSLSPFCHYEKEQQQKEKKKKK